MRYDNLDKGIEEWRRFKSAHIKKYKKKKNQIESILKWFFTFLIAIFFVVIIVNILYINLFSKNIKRANNSSINKNSEEYYLQKVDYYVDILLNNNIDAVINSYNNLGIVKCDGYINFRSEPNEKNTRSIIGLMNNGAACDIVEMSVPKNTTYAKVKSGGMTGYISNKYLITGEEEKNIAKNDIKTRAIVLVDKLRIRSLPTTDGDTEIGTTYKGERYTLIDRDGDWVKVEIENNEDYKEGYINANPTYLSVRLCLNEARTQDLKSDVINYYDNIGVSTAKDYINVRKAAKSNSQVIGKLPGKAGCEILGSSGDFYKIKSGLVTGYVAKQYLATGKKAENLAVQYADLRAIIKIAALKVRSKPTTSSKSWTNVSKEETYIVTEQLDGWVQIEIDGGDSSRGSNKGYISTSNNYVEVRYALEQAIKFTAVAASTGSGVRNNIKNFAIKYIGGKYVWGGNSLSTGVDCSGFVQQVYKNFGVSLPRVSKEQAKKGVEVKSANKKVGDLVFYQNSDGVIDHVAIYIGNNQIVHAASTRSGIKISTWNYRNPVSIRNVLGNK